MRRQFTRLRATAAATLGGRGRIALGGGVAFGAATHGLLGALRTAAALALGGLRRRRGGATLTVAGAIGRGGAALTAAGLVARGRAALAGAGRLLGVLGPAAADRKSVG